MSRLIPAMVDLRRTDEEKEEQVEKNSPDSISSQPDYPYGLCISFDQDTLEKLGLDEDDVEPGDMIHIHGLGLVTSVSKNNNEVTGPCARVEVQLTHLVAVEDESDEDEESVSVLRKLYL